MVSYPPSPSPSTRSDTCLGFLYTQSSNRLWRKNRQSTSGSTCIGHDINRNWPYQWSVSGGASTDPCAEDFKGKAQGDAPETQVLSAWMQKIKSAQGLKLFIDYHSYSQLFMTRKKKHPSETFLSSANFLRSIWLLLHSSNCKQQRAAGPGQGRRGRH